MREVLIVACVVVVAWLGVSVCRIGGKHLAESEAARSSKATQQIVEQYVKESLEQSEALRKQQEQQEKQDCHDGSDPK